MVDGGGEVGADVGTGGRQAYGGGREGGGGAVAADCHGGDDGEVVLDHDWDG